MRDSLGNEVRLSNKDLEIVREINEDYEKNKELIEEYLNLNNVELFVAPNPALFYLDNSNISSLLTEGLCRLLMLIRKTDSYYKQKTTLNGIDFLAEYLYNMNPRYPNRKHQKQHLFDMPWVKNILETAPRPYYPFSLIWSQEVAAVKIQASFRGYLQRKLPEVQEIRSFWRNLRMRK